MNELLGQFPLWNTRPLIRIRCVRRKVDRPAELCAINKVVKSVRGADAELCGVKPEITSCDPPQTRGRLIVHDHRWLGRRLDGPDEIGAVRIVGFAALDWRVTEMFDERLAELSRVRPRLRDREELIHRGALHAVAIYWIEPGQYDQAECEKTSLHWLSLRRAQLKLSPTGSTS